MGQCHKCGGEIPDDGSYALMTPVMFPDEPELCAQFLRAAVPFLRCSLCACPQPNIEALHSFVFVPRRRMLVQLPRRAPPDAIEAVKERTTAMITKTGWEVVFESDLGTLRRRALEHVGELVNILPIGQIETLSEAPEPLEPTGDRDLPYHAALELLGRRENRAMQITPLTEEGDPDPWDVIEGARRRQVARSFMQMCRELINTQFDPTVEVEKRFVPTSFDAQTIDEIAQLFGAVKGRMFYVDSLFAAACTFGGVANPRRAQWAEAAVASFLYPQEFHLDLTPERWRALILPEDLFRALANAGMLRLERLDRLFEIGTALGRSDEIAQRMVDRVRINLPAESVEMFFENVIAIAREKATPKALTHALMGLTWIADLGALEQVCRLAMQRYSDAPSSVVPLLIHTADRLTHEESPALALALLEEAEKGFEWQHEGAAEATEQHMQLLNERGNALRRLFDYAGARHAYEQACQIAGADLSVRNARIARVNLARVHRDEGRIRQALSMLEEVLPHTNDRERFSCLFAIALAHARNGEYLPALARCEEAALLVKEAPIDDELSSFWTGYAHIADAVGAPRPDDIPDRLSDSPHLSARAQLLALGRETPRALERANRQTRSRIEQNVIEIGTGLDLIALAASDPEFALCWANALIAAGEVSLGREALERIVDTAPDRTIAMNAAVLAARAAAAAHDWNRVHKLVAAANLNMLHLVAATARDATITIADAMQPTRHLSTLLVEAPRSEELDLLLFAVADLQSSLRLSVDIASGFLPRLQEPSGGTPFMWRHGRPVQFLQFLDLGDQQIPILLELDAHGARVRRGAALQTSRIEDLARRLLGRIARLPGNATTNVFSEIPAYVAFRRELATSLATLHIAEDRTLLVTPSRALQGVPLHEVLRRVPVAYVPSAAIGLALDGRSQAKRPDVVGEILCWRFNEEPTLVEHLQAGARALAEGCASHGVEYTRLAGAEATEPAVENLLQRSAWVKMSCHGLADPESGRFAFLLSDGHQLPPPLSDILEHKDRFGRFLYEWDEVAPKGSNCRVVFSTACATASSALTRGGELLGLARSFLLSGASAFVAPLWPVPGLPAQRFVNALIQHWFDHPQQTLAEALLGARSELADGVPDWVKQAFIVHGHHNPLNLQ